METDDAGSELNLPEDNTSVRVALRIRPPLPREIIEGCKTCTTVAEGHPQVWIGSNHAFTFDYVFDQNSPQNIIFDNVVKKLLDGCLHGYNATILAYGQTGSGKTYTMGTGFEFDPSADSQGIIPRAVTYLFSQVDKIRKECAAAKADFKIEVQFVELYNEEVVDLLSTTDRPTSAGAPYRPNSANSIRIHEDSSGSIYLVGVQTLAVGSCHETLKVLREGALSRTTASTNMNDTSSRSHAIFTMHVTQTRVSTEFGEAELETLSAKFHFVDLAGSERLKRTLATGDRAKEGISINCGLLALGNVISALGDRNKKGNHVPYRDSKLTRLLQDSLGGNSRTIMIACVSPSDTDFVETLNTLKYANRAKNIKNRIQINQDKSSRTISSLRREIEMLTSELLEYKQGKRQATATSDYSDTHQENILLLTELDSLKSRLKSKQESIDKLTCTVATYETQNELKNLADTDCDLTKMVQKYLLEIEDLRTKLYESEQECEKLRSKQRRLNTSLCSPRQNHLDPAVNNGLLQDARAEIENDKKKLEKISAKSSENDDDDDGSSDSDDTDSEQQEKFEEIAQLTSEISIKELLIDQLEQSHRRVESLKHHYEEKLECLNNKIKATQEERDKVMASLKSGKRSAQVDADYEKKISAMQMEAKKWQQAQKEHVKLVRNQSQYERQIDKLKNEVESLKQIKVKLLRQSKVESAKYRDLEMKRQKEIMSLKKAQRVKDIKLKTLENEKIMKDQVLKRKLEEVNSLKRINRIQMSRKAQGKARPNGSPLKAKSKWSTLQNEIRKSVSIKTTVSSLEKEMLNLIQERTEARKKLKELENIVIKDEFIQEDIESIRTNLAFLEERITEIQNQIAEISSGIKEYDGSELDEVEIQYVFKKVFEMNISNLTEAERSERRIDDLEETNKQLNKEISSLRSLLQYMYNRNNNSSGSGPGSSGLSNEQMDEFNEMPTTIANTCPSVDSMTTSYNSKLRKARRLTSTPQELLGSLENVSTTKSEFLNPNEMVFGNAFTRNSRQTQSLRVNSNTTKRRPQLLRQDTYNVGDKKFQEAPEKLLADQPGKSSNNADNFNTTFLVEQKSPPSSTSLSSSASNNKLTNSIDVNNTCDSPNNVGKGFIRRVSSNLMNKDRVLTITHTMGGHSKPVISMSATDNKLFTGSKDSTAKELDLETGNELRSYVGHPSNVTCVKYIDETQLLLTASGSLVKIWDTRTKNCIKTLMSSGAAVDKAQSNFESRLLQPGETQIQSIALLRNFLLTTFDCRIRAWDLRKLQSSLGILAGKHSANIMCLTTAQDVKIKNDYRDFIVSGSKDHYLKLYELRPDQPTQTIQPKGNLIPPHYDGIESLLIKNTDLYSGSRDMCIKKWDLSTGEMICTAANAHSGWITGLSRLPDEYNLDYVMSSSRDGSVKVWDSSLKEVNRTDISMTSSSNYCVESICVNKRLVFTAGGSTSNSNSTTTSNGIISDYGVQIWTIRDDLRNNNNGKQSSPPS